MRRFMRPMAIFVFLFVVAIPSYAIKIAPNPSAWQGTCELVGPIGMTVLDRNFGEPLTNRNPEALERLLTITGEEVTYDELFQSLSVSVDPSAAWLVVQDADESLYAAALFVDFDTPETYIALTDDLDSILFSVTPRFDQDWHCGIWKTDQDLFDTLFPGARSGEETQSEDI